MDEINLSQDQTAAQKPMAWGLWSTIGFTLIIGIIYLIIEVIIISVFVVSTNIYNPALSPSENIRKVEQNGMLLGISEIIVAPIVIGLVFLFARIRKGISVRKYLGLNGFDIRILFRWVLLILSLAAATDLIKYVTHQPLVPEFMIKAYETAIYVPLLLAAIIIFAPLLEEFIFRGFLFEGIRYSWLGPAGAVILTSLFWTLLHTQYKAFDLTFLFVGGLILGISRLRSKSIFVPIVLHSLINLYSTVELIIILNNVK